MDRSHGGDLVLTTHLLPGRGLASLPPQVAPRLSIAPLRHDRSPETQLFQCGQVSEAPGVGSLIDEGRHVGECLTRWLAKSPLHGTGIAAMAVVDIQRAHACIRGMSWIRFPRTC